MGGGMGSGMGSGMMHGMGGGMGNDMGNGTGHSMMNMMGDDSMQMMTTCANYTGILASCTFNLYLCHKMTLYSGHIILCKSIMSGQFVSVICKFLKLLHQLISTSVELV